MIETLPVVSPEAARRGSSEESQEIGKFVLRGVGWAVPDERLDNDRLGQVLGVEADSITARTGILERRIAGPEDCASSLGTQAALVALERAGVSADTIDLVILSTYTPDRLLCPTSPVLAAKIGASNAGAFDLNAACSGGVTALFTASSILHSGALERVLVVCSDLTTKFIHAQDTKTRLVFGDAAVALLLERPSADGPAPWSVLGACLGADGDRADYFHIPSGGSAAPIAAPDDRETSVLMNGRAIFRFGVEQGSKVIRDLCSRAGIELDDVTWVIPHQANRRIITKIQDRVPIPEERWVLNLQKYGNTASASVNLALAELIETGSVRSGDVILLVAFGAGLTWSGLALRAG